MESKELLTKRRIETLALNYEISDPVLRSIYSKIIENNKPKVFISHSSLEKDFAKKVLCFLYYSNGVSSYVDWQDPNLPSETNAETAEKLKKRIEKSKKIIYIVTYKSLKSAWCSWEIGYADKAKGADNIAILAFKPNNGKWMHNEFIEQYPWISYDEREKAFKVHTLNGNDIPLIDWLR